MLIRKYTTTDKWNVLELFRMNTPDFFDVSEERDFTNYLEYQKEDYFVVEENNQIIGAGGINYFSSEKTARISWDMIHPEFQKKGIGKQLIHHRLTVIRNHPHIKFVVVRTSQHAYKFYLKLGFGLEKIVPDFWAKGFHLYQMKLDVTATSFPGI